MKLIADSGSTKTSWVLIDEKGKKLLNTESKGINPYYQSLEEINSELENALSPFFNVNLREVCFYGAGCLYEEKKKQVKLSLEKLLKTSQVLVETDLLGAARALLQRDRGIACILGTGSNSCLYDGGKIIQNISPMGFILGDEGSGAVLGKLFLSNLFKNQFSNKVKDSFLREYDLKIEDLLDKVYKAPFPNRYLASFAPFIKKNIHEQEVYDMLYAAFSDFYKKNILAYEINCKSVSFVGSIAYHFKEILADVSREYQIKIKEISQTPMEGLIKYHTRNEI